MEFTTKQEAVYLKSESGIFATEDGQKIEWYKLTFANPVTYENHELGFRPGLNFSSLKKGDKFLLSLELEPTSKKSRVLVSGFSKIN